MKPFSDTNEDINKISYELGKKIYIELRNKFPENSVRDMDIILNTLCSALIVHIYTNVEKDNHVYLVQLIHKILTKNTSK